MTFFEPTEGAASASWAARICRFPIPGRRRTWSLCGPMELWHRHCSGLLGLIRSGLLDLRHGNVTAFPLAGANDAVAHAAANAAPCNLTVLNM